MSDPSPTSPNQKGKWLRLGIIGLGTIVFLLLFFADKTNLNNPDQAVEVGAGVQSSNINTVNLPPLAADPQFDTWKAALGTANGESKGTLLDSMVASLLKRNRFGHAAEFMEQRLDLDRSLDQQMLAGKINQQATELGYISQDSLLFKRFSRRAIEYLSTVVEARPEDEEGLLYLGLALTQSRQPQNSMRGILSIRKVLEINPDNIEAAIRLGIFSLQTGQLDKAEQRFEHVLKLQSDNHLARFQLAITRIQQQRLEEAKELLSQVVQEAPDRNLKLEAREILSSLNTK